MKRLREFRLQEVDNRLDELDLAELIKERIDRQIIDIVSKDERASLLDTLLGVAPYTALFLASAWTTWAASPTRSTPAPTSAWSRG